MTYAEFMEMVDTYHIRRTNELNDLIGAAWYTAYLSRVKTLESLRTYLISEQEEPHVQTDDEMMAKCEMLNILFGGSVVEVCDG